MNDITKEYIELFGMVDETQVKVDTFIDLVGERLPYYQRTHLGKIKTGLDWSELREYLGISIESQLTQDDLLEIISTYKNTPALRKLLHKRKDLDASCSKIAERIVSESIADSAHIMHSDLIH